MKLYLLDCKRSVDYDETEAVLVRAGSEGAARKLASHAALQDGRKKGSRRDFLDPERTTCTVITVEGDAEVLLQSDRCG